MAARVPTGYVPNIEGGGLAPPPTMPWPHPYDPGYTPPERIESQTVRDVPPALRNARPEWLALELHKTRQWLFKDRADLGLRLSREPRLAFWRGVRWGAGTATAALLFVWQIVYAVDFLG